MPKVTEINREVCRVLRDKINASLKSLGDELGMKIQVGNASFTADNVKFKLEAAIIGASGEVKSSHAHDFARYQFVHGLPLDSIGKTFTQGRKTFKLVGYNVKGRNYPMLAEDENGKLFKFSIQSVQIALKLPITPDNRRPSILEELLGR